MAQPTAHAPASPAQARLADHERTLRHHLGELRRWTQLRHAARLLTGAALVTAAATAVAAGSAELADALGALTESHGERLRAWLSGILTGCGTAAVGATLADWALSRTVTGIHGEIRSHVDIHGSAARDDGVHSEILQAFHRIEPRKAVHCAIALEAVRDKIGTTNPDEDPKTTENSPEPRTAGQRVRGWRQRMTRAVRDYANRQGHPTLSAAVLLTAAVALGLEADAVTTLTAAAATQGAATLAERRGQRQRDEQLRLAESGAELLAQAMDLGVERTPESETTNTEGSQPRQTGGGGVAKPSIGFAIGPQPAQAAGENVAKPDPLAKPRPKRKRYATQRGQQ